MTEPLNSSPAEPIAEERTESMREALGRLATRLEGLDAMRDTLHQALAQLETRVAAARKQAGELEALGTGQTPALETALAQGRVEYDDQTEQLRASRGELERERATTVAMAEASFRACNDFLVEIVNEQPLFDRAHEWAEHAGRAFDERLPWVARQTERWRPSKTQEREDVAMEEVLALLPDLNLDAVSQAETPHDQETNPEHDAGDMGL